MRNDYYLKDVVTLKLNSNKCTGCGMCRIVCSHSVFDIKEKKAIIKDKDACMECGACSQNCPTGAIQVMAGVGCAFALIKGAVKGANPTCGDNSCCDSDQTCC